MSPEREKIKGKRLFKEIMVKHPKFDEIHESTTARIHKFTVQEAQWIPGRINSKRSNWDTL